MHLPPLRRGVPLLACALLLAARPAQAQEEAAPTAGFLAASDDAAEHTAVTTSLEADDEAMAIDESETDESVSDDGRTPKIKSHTASLAYQGILIQTDGAGRHRYNGPAVAYDYFVGRDIGFAIHGEASFPAYGFYRDGDSQRSGPVYTRYTGNHFNLGASFMAAHRATFNEKLSLTTGLGVHAQWFNLNSKVYSEVEVISMGLGATTRLSWLFHPMLSLDAGLAIAFNPFDMIDHDNPATLFLQYSGTLGLGVRY